MAQTAMTVRLDSQQKVIFDQLCEQFGMSANTAFNIFVRQVIRCRRIPFTIAAEPEGVEEVQRPVGMEEIVSSGGGRCEGKSEESVSRNERTGNSTAQSGNDFGRN
jgi:addiction module RelB/DinJ family antitoxin